MATKKEETAGDLDLELDEDLSFYDLLETDPDKERRGVDVPIGGRQYITVARAGGANKEYTKMLANRLLPYQRALNKQQRLVRAGQMPSEKVARLVEGITQEVYARTVVKGWRLLDRGREEIPFSVENCVKAFRDVPELFALAQDAAADPSTFQREDALEDAAKNS